MKYFPFLTFPAAGAVLALLALIVMACLPGCSTLTTSGTPANVAANTAIELGTTKLIESGASTDAQRLAKAAQIKAVAQQIEALAAGGTATVASLQAVVDARIVAANWSVQDKVLAQQLAAAVAQELAGRVSAGVLSADQVLVLNDVVSAVIAGCALYGA